jgi:hypothetical protein
MVPPLKGNDPLVVCRGITDNVRNVSVQRSQKSIPFLGFGHDYRIRRFGGQVIPSSHDVMPCVTPRVHDRMGHATVGTEGSPHQTATSHAARSRASSRHAMICSCVKVWEFDKNVLSGMPPWQVAKHKTHRNPRALDAWFPT